MPEVEALAISAAVEAPLAFAIVYLAKWRCRGPWHVALASAVATAVTHPQLWEAAFWAYPRFGVWPSLVALETLVVLVEGLLIAWMAMLAMPRAMLVSLGCNTASCLVGLWFWFAGGNG
ncbi:MAG: hypothetical protein KGJ78_04820 [Alphaproteobacteria bacterium]|nr:hypothetical protein [Alphaproteobacteria bacterium]